MVNNKLILNKIKNALEKIKSVLIYLLKICLKTVNHLLHYRHFRTYLPEVERFVRPTAVQS